MIKLKIPATSANLGSGFDAVGVAVNLYNEIAFQEWDSLLIESMDDTPVPTDESNLVYQSVKRLYDECGKTLKGVHIQQWNNIPFARGLGSSSACIVGGLKGGNHLLGNPLSKEDLLRLAVSIEGHPDNVAPALLGGVVAAVLQDEHVYYVKEPLKNDLQFVVVIPDFPLKTTDAREALPKMVSHEDARFNLARSALMVLSLARGEYQNLKVATGDKLHQPYRYPFIKGGQELIDYCYNKGAYAGMISGAGSSLIALVDKNNTDFVPSIRNYLNENNKNWQVASYEVDNIGAQPVNTNGGEE